MLTQSSKLKRQEIYKLVETGLSLVERELERHSTSSIQLIDKVGCYIQRSGGKRIRPALLLLSSRMCGFEGPVCYRLGAVIEMVHAATLVHDDIIDDAKVRRGRAAVNARWGNEVSVLMGDWLYMTSFSLALGERHFPILEILTDVTRKMVEGELIQLSVNGSLEITEEQHLDISMRKTAYLFSACTEIGSILGSANPERREALRLFGLNVGIAFQLIDDVLDFTSNESTLGKPVGSDLREGKITLPLIYLIRNGEPRHREMVKAAFNGDGTEIEDRQAVLELIREYKTVDLAREKAMDYARAAKENLALFPPSKERAALLSLPDYIVERDR